MVERARTQDPTRRERDAIPLFQLALVKEVEHQQLMQTGVRITTSNIATLEKIYDGSFVGLPKGHEAPYMSDEDLFISYKGQQLHMLNQLTVMMIRRTKEYFTTMRTYAFPNRDYGKMTVSPATLKNYFPYEKEPFYSSMAKAIDLRFMQVPFFARCNFDLENPNVPLADVLQLTYNVWRDWRYNQVFTLKERGIVAGGKKENPDFYRIKAEKEQRAKEIWEDKTGEIEASAETCLVNWRHVLGNTIEWSKAKTESSNKPSFDPDHPNIASLLMDVNNTVVFERLVNIRYIIDYSAECIPGEPSMNAAMSGVPDIIVYIPVAGGYRVVIVDFKSTIKEANELETLLTKIQGKTSLFTRHGSLYPVEIHSGDLVQKEDDAGLTVLDTVVPITDVLVYHVNPIQLNNLGHDFLSMEQFIANPFEALQKMQRIVEKANRNTVTVKPILAEIKNSNQAPTTRRLNTRIIPCELRPLPPLIDRIPPSGIIYEQKLLPDMDKIPEKERPVKYKRRPRKKTRNIQSDIRQIQRSFYDD